MAFAARQGDVGQQVQHFARRRWRGAGGLQPVAPLGRGSDGRGGRASVKPGRASQRHGEGVRQRAVAVHVGRVSGGHRGHGARAGVGEGCAGGRRRGVNGRGTGERRGAVGSQRGPQVCELIGGQQGAAVPPRGLG